MNELSNRKVIVGMSGGVDSAVTAYLLKQAGYEVVGVTLRTWVADDGSDGRCCEIDDARCVADFLGIRFVPVNCLEDFKNCVVEPFADEYLHGRTPNPCVTCNRHVKWEKLLYYAKVLGADHIATGHYAEVVKLENGRCTVKKALHAEKDQTYVLYRLTQEQLAATLMPLSKLSKAEVRQIAADAGIPVAQKPDSQDICFVTDGDYASVIERVAKAPVPGEGDFVDVCGNVIGRHKGITHYTVGQRRGLNIALGYPAYACEIRPETNEVVVGDNASLLKTEITCRDCSFLSIERLGPGEQMRCTVKIRYNHPGQSAVIEQADDGRVRITFDSPVRAATPGQSAVFYDDDGCVIGGGIIV